jgi:DNA-binding transcriptional ArsR family regulator
MMLRIEPDDEDRSEELEELFKALGNINRLILIYCLASTEKKSFSVTEMAEMMGLTQPAASQHLKILKTVNILHSTKQGNYIYYTFNKNALVEHKEKIDSLFCCVFNKCEHNEE